MEDDELDKLIARWNHAYREIKAVPTFWGILWLVFCLSLWHLAWTDSITSSLILILSVIFCCIFGGTYLKWRISTHVLLPKLLQYDDFRLVPCLIRAATSHHPEHRESAMERLTHYFNLMTVNDSALLSEADYQMLHLHLLGSSLVTNYRTPLPASFRFAILRVIKEMGHTHSVPTLQKLIAADPSNIYYSLQTRQAVEDCLDALLIIQEQAKQDSTLLRPSQVEATPDTLLRAAMPTTHNTDNLLKPSNATPNHIKKF